MERILFVQLPLSDHNMDYIQGNVPYGPESIAGYCTVRYAHVKFSTLPFPISSFGSDLTIVKYILAEEPDTVCFTCYAWNVERNLRIAAAVKSTKPWITIFCGGPEIMPGSAALDGAPEWIDLFAAGEGEWFFDRYMAGAFKGLRPGSLVAQPQNELIPPAHIFEPFTGRRLNAMTDGSVFLELARGCPFRCSYCFYSKNSPGVRELAFRLLIEALHMKDIRDLTEIYVLTPTFNASPAFAARLEEIKAANRGVALHTEMRAAGISKETARLMKEAGFRSLEIGLQTLTPAALTLAGRPGNIDAELEGMLHLKEAGIDLKAGMIPGLPGDDPESFNRGLERLASLGLTEQIELYNLMVLPGTRVREIMGRIKGARYQEKPPYFFLGSDEYGFNDLARSAHLLEGLSGYSPVMIQAPDLTVSAKGILVKSVSFNATRHEAWEISRYSDLVQTSPFTFQARECTPSSLREGVPRLLARMNDGGLYNLVFYGNFQADEEFLAGFMEARTADSYHMRSQVFRDWRDSLPVRFYQVFDDIESFGRGYESYGFVEPMFRVSRQNIRLLPKLGENAMLLITDGCYEPARKFLMSHYSEAQELAAFENEEERRRFYADTGSPAVTLPFSFSTAFR